MSEDLWIGNTDDLNIAPTTRVRVNINKAGHIGCPLWWFALVFPVVRGKNELAVALFLYRLHTIRRSRTVKLSNERLAAEIGVDRYAKYRTLRRLANAGIITIKRRSGQALEITFQRGAVRGGPRVSGDDVCVHAQVPVRIRHRP